MSTVNRKEVMNEIYDSALITLGLVGLSWSTNKIFKIKMVENLNDLESVLKLGGGMTASTLLVKWMQSNKWIPTDPFKT